VPIYEYQCEDCGASFEALQKMSDDPLTECEKCGGPLRKVLHPVAIHFKGSGFYTTDYGKGSGRRTAGKDGGSSESSSGAGESSSGDGDTAKSDKKPGESKPKETQKAT
jgi:putative FmdB family regulatory protein